MMGAKKRVLMVAYSYYPWDPRIKREAMALSDAGYVVDIICLKDVGEKRFQQYDNINVYRLPLKVKRGGGLRYIYQYLVFFILSFFKVTDLFLHRRHYFIHVHTLPDFEVFSAFVPWLFGSRVILDMHEMMPELFAARFGLSEDSWKMKVVRWVEEVSILFADEVLTAVDSYKDVFVERGATPEKITVVMNTPSFVSTGEKRAERYLRKHGLLEKELLIYAGGINPERDIITLVRAVEKLALKREDLHLLIFGHGDEEYIRKVRNIAPMVSVSFGGTIPAEMVVPFLKHSKIGVVTYERNPLTERALPTKVFEYAFLDKSMVLPDLPLLRKEFSGVAQFYEPENVESLVSSLEKLLDDPGMYSGEVAKKTEKYRWEVMEKRLLGLYEKLWKEKEY